MSTPTRHFNLADLFEIVVENVPDRLALVAADRRLTYRELDERANRLARHLLDQGLQPGSKVAIYSWNRAEWVESFLAAFKARLIPINVNYRYVAHELRYLFDNCDAEALVFERSFAPTVAEIADDLPKLQTLLVLEDGSDEKTDARSYEDALAASSPDPLGIERSADDLYFLYTGGTTGMPKGVMWRAEDIYFAALSGFSSDPIETPEALAGRLLPDDFAVKALIVAPLMHGAAQWGMMNLVYMGGTVVLYSDHAFDPAAVWALAEQEQCLSMMLVGDAMARPLADVLAAEPGRFDLTAMKQVGSGGAVFSTAVKDQLRELIPGVNIADSYGASETGASGTSASGDDARRFVVSPEMNVLDDELRPVEPGSGITGRLARTGHIPLGYYKDEAKTAATFMIDPDGRRWVVPGDFGVVEADGTITLFGRGSQCINSGGEKIYPEEVEEALKSHPAVFDALVVGVPDDRFGERVAAVVAARPGASPTLEELSAHCRQTLAGYKVPRQLTLVDAVRRSPAGKANYGWAKETAVTDPS